jgi:hypothetical protein
MKWNTKSRRLAFIGLLIISAINSGCGARSELAAIKGRVKFKNGEVINRGTIEYTLTGATTVDQSGARIVDGAYEIPQDKGLRPGKYIVRIYSPSSLLSPQGAQAVPGARPTGGGGQTPQLPQERVSPEFNSQSKLIVEVNGEAVQTFDFEVE